jgi:diadenosine tetraphosphate (Ap4A) HIT family hydrolase
MTDLEQAQKDSVAPWDLLVDELSDYHVSVFQDRFPVSRGHLLFVPKYNNDSIVTECFEAALRHGRHLVATGECSAFNIGINMGYDAGQTVMYPHVHLIPRRGGDTANPVGGVRAVIFGQADYRSGGYTLPES